MTIFILFKIVRWMNNSVTKLQHDSVTLCACEHDPITQYYPNYNHNLKKDTKYRLQKPNRITIYF